MKSLRCAIVAVGLATTQTAASGQAPQSVAPSRLPPQASRTFSDPGAYPPDVNEAGTTSELRDLVARYAADRLLMQRFHSVPGGAGRAAKFSAFHAGWLRDLEKVAFDRLSQQGKVDYLLLRTRIQYDRRLLDREAATQQAVAPLLPFHADIASLQEARQRLEFVDTDQALAALRNVQQKLDAVRAAIAADTLTAPRPIAVRAARQLEAIRTVLNDWFLFYKGYDPAFTARVPAIYEPLDTALREYGKTLREQLAGLPPGAAFGGRLAAGGNAGRPAGAGPSTSSVYSGTGGETAPPLVLGQPIIGDPVGRDALLEDLQAEMIVYTPEQLIEIGNREYAWCENELKRAARELGFGDDWRAALEQVKNAYVPRGKQPELVRNLQIQAETFIRERDLVTIPPIVHDNWRMVMMAPAQMRSAPFFLGGESIIVSYPVDGMSEELSTMIMKGNGPHLSHATVFHELIPGHNLQMFMAARYNTHRSLFTTPFYGEGWALYWELQLWDLGFHATPEDRIGALFWRMHRAARIVFTMNYQMGRWTPAQCVEFLVRNGHERYTAEGEVRGHVQGSSPLYQISYLTGALQLRALYKELVVDRKRMTMKQFNDAVVLTGSIPIEMVSALLTNRPLTRDYRAQWKYYGDVPPALATQEP
jgi:uncharacterized protein (DUF885 family)